MTPDQRQEFEDMKKTLQSLLRGENVEFIKSIERQSSFITQAQLDTLQLGDLADVSDDATTGQVIKKQSDGSWQGADDIDT